MLLEVNCTTCKKTHFDHYACSDCNYNFGFSKPRMNFCPNCGTKLVYNVVEMTCYKKNRRRTKHGKLATPREG